MSLPLAKTTLFTADQIRKRVSELARDIDSEHSFDEPLHVVVALKGSFIFAADLIRAMGTPLTLDFIAIGSYTDGTTSGEIQLQKDLDSSIEGRPVLIVEDIVDTGRTLRYLQKLLRTRAPKSLRTVCLMTKPSRRAVEVTVDYVGFEVGDRFIVGYGLDHGERYRHLAHITTLEEPRVPRR
ncbi:MAG TPA: hypoxanthine phosphoribosyltransferase [Acidobacteria bacterium]|jgi:hypoxanthine phosphoribosyltransferase|nr:hypoxanthine phosphoribosyltransferase [Acidobacteriota bacterium]